MFLCYGASLSHSCRLTAVKRRLSRDPTTQWRDLGYYGALQRQNNNVTEAQFPSTFLTQTGSSYQFQAADL